MMKKTIICILIIAWAATAHALQYKVISENVFCKIIEINVAAHQNYDKINGDFGFTSLSIEIKNTEGFDGLRVFVNQKYDFKPQNDVRAKNGWQLSNLLIFDDIQDNIQLQTDDFWGVMRIYLLHAPALPPPARTHTIAYPCQQPAAIPQAVWRAGLPNPTPNPTPTQVHHTIIHHTATQNTATNYTNAVRNIYLYHTQTNGWDDIGYNYLIAPNGDLYTGRDPQNADTQDNIRGAHFCAKNTNTMGIALIGDYMQTPPDTAMMNNLGKLLLWKLYKEQLSPTDSTLHPVADPVAILLPNVCGHQDGCATDCPGTLVYSLIPNLRLSLAQNLRNCPPASTDIIPKNIQNIAIKVAINTYQIHASGIITLINIYGSTVWQHNAAANQNISIDAMPSGIYILKQHHKTQKIHLKNP